MKSLHVSLAALAAVVSLLTAAVASAEPVPTDGDYQITTLRGEGRLRAMAVDPGRQSIYFADTADRGVWVMDAPSRRYTGFVQLGRRTGDLAVDSSNGTVYAALDDGVAVIDGATKSVVATVPVPRPLHLAVDPGTHAVYVSSVEMCGNACFGDGTISVIDGTTRTLVGTMSAGSGSGELAVDPATHAVYVAGTPGISVFDGTTRALIATLPVSASAGFAVDLATNTVYASGGGDISVLDSTTHTLTATIPVDVGHHTWPYLAVDTGDHTLYVATATGVSVIDPATRTVTAAISLPGSGPRYVAVGPGTHTLFVTYSPDNVLYLIDRRT